MLSLVKLLGIVILGYGIAFLMDLKRFDGVITFWKQGKRLYAGGVIKALCGLVFILGGTDYECRMPGVIFTIGVLSLLGGVSVFVLGLKKVEKMMDGWANRPVATKRLLAVIYVAMGVLIVYSA